MPPHPARPDRGSVTAETAVALPALLVVAGAACWCVWAVAAQLRCAETARAAARALARGETEAEVVRAAGAADVRVTASGADVTVLVSAPVPRPPGPLGRLLPSLEVRAGATAAVEPGVTASGVPP